jgi:hypothetical protein
MDGFNDESPWLEKGAEGEVCFPSFFPSFLLQSIHYVSPQHIAHYSM